MSDFEILDGVGGWALDRLIRMCEKSFISFFLPVITKGFEGGYFFVKHLLFFRSGLKIQYTSSK